MVISLLLPGIMIFLLYSIMGDVMSNNLGQSEDQVYTLKVENEPTDINSLQTLYHLI